MALTASMRRGVLIASGLMTFGIASTLILGLTDSDLDWTSRFYMGCDRTNHWPATKTEPFAFLYKYGEIPGVALGIIGLLGYLLVRLGKCDKSYSKPFLIVFLCVILGPGLLVNGLFKEFWGRPRPADLSRFGSTEQYRQFWDPGGPGSGKSFVCGHCAIAFSTCSTIAFYPLHPVAASIGLGAGLIYGSLVSLTRLAQGGHFSTDIIWSAVIVLTLIVVLYYFVFRIPEMDE